MKIEIEGELIHHWWAYEADDLTIDGRFLQVIIDEQLPHKTKNRAPAWVSDEPIEFWKNFGSVRITIEQIEE